ncbi:uncharacterized protein N7515_008450 [Penicillium bovifimosum]|uniref:CCHC-type domain-containing protein n=1 Tax=Penicillium bovifimosum TaxID=126998 RepID=A0A9W9GNF3_9EURO|nr:uncharacterized protein N7515_008444 [Penicillium bovifimosum]XP_056519024.1 uncharacterized protein N7515_008450 [Penicillium bovifimosum]KAJ5124619.1 hypothetical protein N7515_008444 [Penicillium bovifimosum]KAJ5124625.1 hypothetical protein N7515_008450 [Penicillium bovifimosum]
MSTSPITNDPKDMPPGRCLEILWCEAMQNIEAAKGQILVPNNIVRNVLGMDNLQEMYRRLCNMNNGIAYMHFDESLDSWYLSTTDKDRNERTPAPELQDYSIKEASKAIYRFANLVTPPKPNCFVLYRQANQRLVKESNPGASNDDISEKDWIEINRRKRKMSTTRSGKRRIQPDEEPEETHEHGAPLPQTGEATQPSFSARSTPVPGPSSVPRQQYELHVRTQTKEPLIIRDEEALISWIHADSNHALAYLTFVQQQRQLLTERVRELERTASSPATQTSSGGGKRSAKVPDAPILDDGVSVKFTPWRRAVENKLMLNADHYPSERHRMAYVSTRCAGKAQAQLQPSLDPTVSNRYKTAVEMLDHLQIVFKDPMERQIAKGQYEKLKMKEGESFNLFYGEFARLALESKTDEELQKGDLFEKLVPDLQTLTVSDAFNDRVTLEEFVDSCRRSALGLSCMQTTTRFRKSRSRPHTENDNKGSLNTFRTTTPSGEQKQSLTYAERQALMKEGKCFVCRQQGHLSRDCPENKDGNGGEAKTAAVSATERRLRDAEDSDSSSSSGNV